MVARCSAFFALMCFAMGSSVLMADEPPRPPQPPLSGETLREWRDELTAIYNLRDNAFLHDEAERDFTERVASWQGAAANFNLAVARVTKEGVVCESLGIGEIAIRNEQEPIIDRQDRPDRRIVLRIGDVIPLDVARRLRAGDQLVLRGVVTASGYQAGRELALTIGKSEVVAVVAWKYQRDTTGLSTIAIDLSERANREQLFATPPYPAGALASGAGGQAVVAIAENQVKLAKSAGNSQLDAAAINSFRRLQRNTHLL